jgi:hypothetical protein
VRKLSSKDASSVTSTYEPGVEEGVGWLSWRLISNAVRMP